MREGGLIDPVRRLWYEHPVCGDMTLTETIGYGLLKVGARLWLGKARANCSGYLEGFGWEIRVDHPRSYRRR